MDADPKKLRAWGRLLSTLLQTPDDELDDFMRERMGGARLEERFLARVRDLLVHVGEAFDDPDPERWKGLAHAADALEQWEEGRARGSDERGAGSEAPTSGPALAPGSVPPRSPTPPGPAGASTPAEHHPARGPSPWTKGMGANGMTPPPVGTPSGFAPTGQPAPVAAAPRPALSSTAGEVLARWR